MKKSGGNLLGLTLPHHTKASVIEKVFFKFNQSSFGEFWYDVYIYGEHKIVLVCDEY